MFAPLSTGTINATTTPYVDSLDSLVPCDSFDPSLISRVVIWTRLAPSTPLSLSFFPLLPFFLPLLLFILFVLSLPHFTTPPPIYLYLHTLSPGVWALSTLYIPSPAPPSRNYDLLGNMIRGGWGEIRGKLTYLGYSCFRLSGTVYCSCFCESANCDFGGEEGSLGVRRIESEVYGLIHLLTSDYPLSIGYHGLELFLCDDSGT